MRGIFWRFWLNAVAIFGCLAFALQSLSATVQTPEGGQVSFSREIRPIFQAQCLGCHQPAKKSGQFLMTDFASLLSGGSSGDAAIVPGKPDESYLVDLITPVDGKADMPHDGQPLSEKEIALIRKWIEQGAINDSPVTRAMFDAEHPPQYQRLPILTSLDVSPDGKTLAINGLSEVVLYDIESKKVARRLIGRSPRVESVSFSPDGQRLAVVGGKPGEFGELQIWNLATGDLNHSISVTGDTLFGVSWSPDGRLVAFGATDNTVRAVEAESGKQVLFQNVAEDWIRDTVFSAAGTHLISVGRDMTCKLTEVATERFVDNITSITPGVLKGGISSVARHPQRDEIMVGSSDGIPKLYRVFRETKRVIGDDANLIRQFPQMLGRVQSVAVSPDGKKMAATSGLDGRSELRVFSYEFETAIPDAIKAINSKVVTSRSAEEKKRLLDFVTSDIVELAKVELPQTMLYAIAFAADSQAIFVGGSDGVVREVDTATGAIRQEIRAFELRREPVAESVAASYRLPLVAVADHSSSSTQEIKNINKLIVLPSELKFHLPTEYRQMVVQAIEQDGTQHDVTALAEYSGASDLVAINENFIAEPIAKGSGELRVAFGGLSVTVPVESAFEPLTQVDFIRDVNPLLGRIGCNGGTCHGSQNGKRGFKLSLRGYDPIFDVRALTDDLASRRVNVVAPEESLMLLKSTGQVPHEGGAVIKLNDKNYSIIRRWIEAGAMLDLSVPRVSSIKLEPQLPVLADVNERQQMRVVATYSDGTQRDVTREAFLESSDQEVAAVNAVGQAMARRRGEAAILARYEGAFAATTLTVMGQRPGFIWTEPVAFNEIDRLIAGKWERMKIVPSDLCDDSEFLRRVSLDLIGLPPSADSVRAFVADTRPTQEKRNAVIDSLIGSPEFVDHWTNKWSDLLQVNEKFLAKSGAEKLHHWIRDQVQNNVPYDQFVRSIITASGSNAENPAAAYYKILRTPEDLMENTTHLFLATRFNCNKCHDHPFERWTQDQYYQTAAFFAQVKREPDPAGANQMIGGTEVESATPLYELIGDATSGEVTHDRTKLVTAPAFPFDSKVDVNQPGSRREKFAQWLTSADNPYFATSHANRLWGYLMGVGLIEPIDDIRASNPPSNPLLLAYLTKELVDHNFDSRHLIRLICQSRTYQLSVSTNPLNEDDRTNYSHALPRRLPAEVLYDALYYVTGSQTHIPGEPPGIRAAQLADAGAKLPSGLLATLGKPVRESACECERANDLHLGSVLAMVSGPDQALAIDDSNNAIAALVKSFTDNRQLINEIYLRVLNRQATDVELDLASSTFSDVESDHQRLLESLSQRAAAVAPEYDRLEKERLGNLAAAEKDLQEFIAATDPDIVQKEAAHAKRLADLRGELNQFEATIDDQVARWRTDHLSTIQWHSVLAAEVTQSSGAEIKRLPDRSIVTTESKGKTVTTVIASPDLSRISALRIEALAMPERPGGGPGISPNGNFVLNEFSVEMEIPSAPDQWKPVKLTSALADFSQASFDVAKTIDGDRGTGWAVVPEGGKTHWATFQLETPLAPVPGTRLRFSLTQDYGNQHELARFRISLTPSPIPVGLSVSDEQLEVLTANPASWSEENRQRLRALVRAGSPPLLTLKSNIAMAEVPLAIDAGIVQRREVVQRFSQATPRDAELVRLEQDATHSTRQLAQQRLTAAQDLTWALINSPAFLFNH